MYKENDPTAQYKASLEQLLKTENTLTGTIAELLRQIETDFICGG